MEVIHLLSKDLNIMVISTTCLEVPPPDYGGVELIVYNLCSELSSRGYNVTCVAPQGTEIEGVNVIETVEPSSTTDCFQREPEAYEIYAPRMPEADVIIDHSWHKHSYIGKNQVEGQMEDTTILSVWHGMPSVKQKPPVDNPCYMSVSKAASEEWASHTGLEVRHAYNGIDLDKYPLRDTHFTDGDYFLTLNRIMEEKGIHEFILAADEMGKKFKVAGEDTFIDDPGYVHEAMRYCYHSSKGEYLGRIDQKKKIELLRNAKATVLLPMKGYQEVFGLAAVESMACGTPVICLDNNGLSEVVEHPFANCIAENMEQVKECMSNIDGKDMELFDIHHLRDRVETHFSKEVMTDMYLERCEQAINNPW